MGGGREARKKIDGNDHVPGRKASESMSFRTGLHTCDKREGFRRKTPLPPESGLAVSAWFSAPLGCAGGGSPEAEHGLRLGSFLALDDVELNVIALFQRFVPVQLNR